MTSRDLRTDRREKTARECLKEMEARKNLQAITADRMSKCKRTWKLIVSFIHHLSCRPQGREMAGLLGQMRETLI